jgi:hypothetical protein
MRSKITMLGAIAAWATVALTPPASADIGQFLGEWHNIDPNTRGIVRILITEGDGAIKVHVWGRCHPEPCDWGEAPAVPYAANVDAAQDTEYLRVEFRTWFAVNELTIGPASDRNRQLSVTDLNQSTDGSGRPNFAYSAQFTK